MSEMKIEKTNENKNKSLKIGIDNGGVCSMHASPVTTEEGHTSRAELDMDGAIEVLKSLKSAGHILSLESFSGKTRAKATQVEITDRFPNLFDAFHFTKDKKYKADIVEHYGLDVFIDDSYDIILQVASQNKDSTLCIWFQGDPIYKDKNDTHSSSNMNVRIASNWKEVEDIISSDAMLSKPGNVNTTQRIGFLDQAQLKKRLYL